ncbi:MAG: hypothetical protein V4671_20400 [Armatimonadota bacterium]
MTQMAILFLTVVHVGAGLLCLVLGPAAFIAPKGSQRHRRAGLLYLRLMLVMASSALLLLTMRFNTFFFVLAVFSFYLAFSGYRVLGRKRPDRDQQAKPLDWSVALLAMLVGIVSISLHLAGRLTGDSIFIFSMLGGTVAIATYDLVRFINPVNSSQPQQRYVWLFEHLSKMIGSYIAVVSAFSATVLGFIPEPARQLWPVATGVPIMLSVILSYRRKFRENSAESFQPLRSRLPEG